MNVHTMSLLKPQGKHQTLMNSIKSFCHDWSHIISHFEVGNVKAIMLNSKKRENLCLLNIVWWFRWPTFVITWALSHFISWHCSLCCFNGTNAQMFLLLLEQADNLTDESYSKALGTLPISVCMLALNFKLPLFLLKDIWWHSWHWYYFHS